MDKIWLATKMSNQDTTEIVQSCDISNVMAHLLLTRGYSTPTDVSNFFESQLDEIYNYSQFPQMSKMVTKLQDDINAQNTIRVIGDYDIDGVFATYILY